MLGVTLVLVAVHDPRGVREEDLRGVREEDIPGGVPLFHGVGGL